MKRALLIIATLVGLLLAGLAAGSVIGGAEFFMALITPSGPFDEYAPPPVPDYADLANWGALPDRDDMADAVPKDVPARDRQADAAADVFYIHPTAYFSPMAWNAATDNSLVGLVVDYGMLAGQASAFNEAARIYAPRYRVMTLGGYTAEPAAEGRDPASALAYSDVRRAFAHYLEHWNAGRPILIASHSQGTHHARRLLAEFFVDKPLADQLVAAYLVGYVVSSQGHAADSPLPSCQTPTQIGCVVSWMTFGEGGDVSLFPNDLPPGETPLCTNPLSWRSDATPVPKHANPGSTRLDDVELHVVPGVVGARCHDGYLYIDAPDTAGFDSMQMPGANYHAWDYSFFYMSARANAVRRVQAFLER